MAAPKVAWGIDMGQCAMKALKLRVADEGKVEALAAEYIEHRRILSQPDADRAGMIRAAIEQFLQSNELGKDPVVVSVPGQHTLARFSKLPPIEKKKIPDIVRFEAGQQIPFDVDDVIWDYQTFTEEGSPEISVGIFAMRRELIGDHLLHYANAEIEPAMVQSNPLALYNALTFDGQCAGQATVILDIGAENTDLIVADGRQLWTRTIPLGGNTFTEALVKAFKLKFSKAENLKRTAATSKYARQVFQAMRPVFADLVAEVQRSIGFYTSSHRGVEIGRIIAMGNAFKLPGLQKFLQQNLGIEVKRPSNFRNLDVTSSTNSPLIVENLLSFGVTYGLALQGLGQTHIVSNLLPPEIAKQVIWRRKRLWFAASAACLMLSAGAVWGRNFLDSRALADHASDRQQTQQILRRAQQLRQQFDAKSGEGKAERDRVENILALGKSNDIWLGILDLVHAALPAWQEPIKMDSANTPEAYRTAAGGDERSKREQIFIESLRSSYAERVDEAYASAKSQYGGRSAGGRFPEDRYGQAETEAQGGLAGFVLELKGSTPNGAGINFVEDNFQKTLEEMERKSGMGFFVQDAEVVTCVRRGRVAAQGVPTATPSRRRGPRSAAPRGPGPEEPETTEVDPVTQEAIDQDWVFTMLVAVALGEPPQPAPSGDAAAEQGRVDSESRARR